jgi:hypothetical protein
VPASLRRIGVLTVLAIAAGIARPGTPPARTKTPATPAKTSKAAKTATASSVTSQKIPDLWSLQPVVRPQIPGEGTASRNPIDAFIAAKQREKGLSPVGPADKLTLLRRVYLDLIGIPPTPAEQDAFLQDESPDAYEKVVDKLLSSEQHGVRYARHWLDVLRYADADERMYAAPGIHLWRDWVIYALNTDMPYDQFVRTQLTGLRSTERTQISNIGYRSPVEPRPEDMFARGLLARGAVVRDNKDTQELPIVAVETVSTAFMGLTVGCAKCHDHMYDPITQRDFYRMKALFDPLVVKKITLASPADIMARARSTDESEARRAAIEGPLNALIAPYKQKLYEERVAMVPPEVQAIVRKPEKERTPAEQKIADDYFPVLRIDAGPIREILTPEDRKKYEELQQKLNQAGGRPGGRRGGGDLAAFWTVEVDGRREVQPSYILTSGDPERPEKEKPVEPGWPFAPQKIDFREGRIEAFSDWLTAPENPLFARVAMNRLWQWHFGEGLHKTSSDFGVLGGTPSNQRLLDWLAAEFVARKFSMKQMHKLIVTSETYRRASTGDPATMSANARIDPANAYLSTYPLRRLEAEAVWDSILWAANDLDLTVGGPSFDLPRPDEGRRGGFAARSAPASNARTNRRGTYIVRGFSTSRDIVPNFLQSFDVEDGRLPCPLRTQTVTAPQALFLMNSDEVEKASGKLAARLQKETAGDISAAIGLGYKITLGRSPSASEKDYASTYVENDPTRLKGLAWLLFNLDEFIYVQ